jgi:hypothetical protein
MGLGRVLRPDRKADPSGPSLSESDVSSCHDTSAGVKLLSRERRRANAEGATAAQAACGDRGAPSHALAAAIIPAALSGPRARRAPTRLAGPQCASASGALLQRSAPGGTDWRRFGT